MVGMVLACYFFILGLLCIFGAHRIYLTRLFLKNARTVPRPPRRYETLPRVTVQLPVFNEKFVVERLIEACAAIDYPRDRLQIQVLDDSTDETGTLAKAKVDYYRALGFDIHYIHRTDRTGFKAGALAHGLQTANGELVAIFDADFVPTPGILRETVHHFTDPGVGMVQTRWDHLNRDTHSLTRIQAIMLDAHFMVEHGARCFSGLFFNFNGTAGIWRRKAIEDAGGWQHDTLTEDLDLSYRAQLKGWRFLFLPQVTCPAELPTRVTSFKSQQHRWAKGAIQVLLKLYPSIWKSRFPFSVKLEAAFHLAGNFAYLLMMLNSICFVIPAMMLRHGQPWWQILFLDGPLFLLASMSFVYFYLSSQKAIFGSAKGSKRQIPALMAIGIGLGVNNARAVIEALAGRESGFVRTPKTGVTGDRLGDRLGDRTRKKAAGEYLLPKSGWGYLEILLGLAYSGAVVWAVLTGNWASIPFLVLFQNGFLYVGWMTLTEHRRGSPRAHHPNESDLRNAA